MVKILIYILIGLSLSIDSFTIAISYGTLINKKYEKILMTSLIGIFHFIMPVIGYNIANSIKSSIIINTKYIVFVIFLILIFEMLKDDNNKKKLKINIITIITASVVVSIDSLSIGIILGLSKEKIIIASALFSLISSITTFIGINIGNIITKNNRKSDKIIGVSLLVLVALKYLIYG